MGNGRVGGGWRGGRGGGGGGTSREAGGIILVPDSQQRYWPLISSVPGIVVARDWLSQWQFRQSRLTVRCAIGEDNVHFRFTLGCLSRIMSLFREDGGWTRWGERGGGERGDGGGEGGWGGDTGRSGTWRGVRVGWREEGPRGCCLI